MVEHSYQDMIEDYIYKIHQFDRYEFRRYTRMCKTCRFPHGKHGHIGNVCPVRYTVTLEKKQWRATTFEEDPNLTLKFQVLLRLNGATIP